MSGFLEWDGPPKVREAAQRVMSSVEFTGFGVSGALSVILYAQCAASAGSDRRCEVAIRLDYVTMHPCYEVRCSCTPEAAQWRSICCAHALAAGLRWEHDAGSSKREWFHLLKGMPFSNRLAAHLGEGLRDGDLTPEIRARMKQMRQRQLERSKAFLAGWANSTEVSAPAKPAAEHRLVLRLTGETHSPVQVVLQKRNAKGSWTAGRGIDHGFRMPEEFIPSAADAFVIMLLQRGWFTYGMGGSRLEEWRAVLAHPHLFTSEDAAAEVETATIEVDVVAEDEDYRVVPRLSCAWSGSVAIGKDVAVQTSDDTRRVAVAPMSALQRQLFSDHRMRIDRGLADGEHFRMLAQAVGARLPEGLAGRPVPGWHEPQVRLRRLGEAGLDAAIVVQPHPSAPAQVPGSGAATLPVRSMVRGGVVEWLAIERSLMAEHDAAQALRQRLGLEESPGFAWGLPAERAIALLGAIESQAVVCVWDGTPLRVIIADSGALTLRIASGRDWLGLGGQLTVDGATVALAELLQASRGGRSWIRLDGDRLVRLGEDLQRRISLLAAAGDDKDRAGTFAAPLIEEAIAGLDDAQVEADRAWMNLQRRLRAAGTVTVEPPKGLRAELRDYQQSGQAWLTRLAAWGAGALLADDMGLGKTVQAIAMLLRRAGEGPALIVCPTSVEGNWLAELKRFAPGLRIRLLREAGDSERRPPAARDVVIASFGLAVRRGESLAERAWATLIIDEAQWAKNPAAKVHQALHAIDAGWRLCMTGTPIENRLDELWAVMRLCVPGLLSSREAFAERFARPIEQQHSAAARESLRRRIAPFILRRTKEQVVRELPSLTESVRSVELDADERRIYEAERLRSITEVERAKAEGRDPRFAILTALTRLRQAACASRLLLAEVDARSSKLELLAELLHELRGEGHRALVFSQFARLLDLAEARLRGTGITSLRLDGSTPAAKRRELVERFQSGAADCFLISLKAGGSGLNLTAASYVIHIDPWWNPAAEDQATDRAHRIGQEKPVTVYRLVTSGTVEEKILDLHREKRDLVDAVLDDSGRAAQLDPEALLALMRDR